MSYGQFCPIAKAMDLLGDRWTILIIRELLMGASRFNELQRGLGSISTAVLTTRLKSLAENGILVRKRLSGMRGYEYFPTSACKELLPIIVSLGEWGMHWAKNHLVDEDYDVELLMLYLERTVDHDMLPGPETTLRFEFTDLKQHRLWWLVASDKGNDVCCEDPGKDVDVYFSSTLRVMTDVWLGHRSYREAKGAGELTLVGPSELTRHVSKWLRCEIFLGEHDRFSEGRTEPIANRERLQ
jgi:DNA-binding HxlR family transcriptional regulator